MDAHAPNRFALALAALLMVVAPVATTQARAADGGVAMVGKRAPKFLLEKPSGGDLTLRDYAGKPLVMNVFASWCPPCRVELPLISASARKRMPRVAYLGVDAQESSQIATTFARAIKLPFPIAIDHGQFAASYGAVSLPITVFVDRRGIVRAIQHGTIDAASLERDLALIAP
ncbi:MAG: TlpA disulfide reductase family protein [Vulcanimicrobiaceae bacterium]